MSRTAAFPFVRLTGLAACLVALMTAPGAANDCLICDREVVLDRKLAACFLSRYDILQTKQSQAIPVDLTDCPEIENAGTEQDRGVVEALKMPLTPTAEPDATFMITRAQLSCLKHHLEQPDVALDPAARFALDDCE